MARTGSSGHKPGRNSGLKLEEFEPRLLLSADAAGVFAPDVYAAHQPATNILLDDNLQPVAATPNPAQSTEEHLELAFVDSDTDDYRQLVDDLISQRNDGRLIEIIMLDNARDGVSQISETLQAYSGVDAIHIISHGADGVIDLGSGQLNSDNIAEYEQQLRSWDQFLDADADILIYGCNLAASGAGEGLVAALADLTGADVAASSDLTGHASLGGDWELEYREGTIDSHTITSLALQQAWEQSLAVTVVDPSTSGSTADQASLTISHTSSGSNRLMLVGVSMTDQGETVDSVTYNGAALTRLGVQQNDNGKARVEIWGRVAPDVGTFDVVVNLSGTGHNGVIAGVTTFTGVNQTAPTLAVQGTWGNSANASTSVTSASDDMVFSVVASHKGSAVTPDPSQTEQWDLAVNNANGGGSVEAGSAVTSSSWTVNSAEWAVLAISVQADTNNAETAALSATQDTYIQLKNPTTSAGSSTAMVIDREDGDLQRALVQFDLSAIPAGATIQSATLTLEATDVGGELTIEAYQLLEAWAEDSATWQQGSSGVPWGTPGSSFSAASLDSILTAATGPHSFDVTALAQDWLGGTKQNYGIMVGSPDGGGDRTVTYATSEGPLATQPTLEIIYTPAANSAPVLDDSPILNLDPVAENSGSPVGQVGTRVSSLVDLVGGGGRDNVTDPDGGAATGIAITLATTGLGSWHYSTDDGASWNPLVGVSESNALLLTDDPDSRIYFQPNPGFSGLAANQLNFRAWDQTTGTNGGFADATVNGGASAFSAVLEYVSAPVSAVNDAPVLTNGITGTIFENGSGLAPFFTTGTVSDPDSADLAGGTLTFSVASGGDGSEELSLGAFAGVTTSGSDVLVSGVQVGTYAGGVSGTPLVVTFDADATVSRVEAVFKALAIRVASEDPTPGLRSLEVVVTDGDGGTSNIATASATFSAVNDPPTATIGPSAYGVNEDDGYRSLSGFSIGDVDAGNNELAVSLSANDGRINLTTATGLTFTSGANASAAMTFTGTVTDLNAALASLTYRPDADFAGTDLLTLQVNDQGNTGGGALTANDTANIIVSPINDAPVLTAGTISNLTVNEDSGLTSLGLTAVAYGPGGGTDENAQTLTYSVNTIPTVTSGDVFLADGTTRVAIGNYTLAEIRGMQFKPADDWNGVTGFQFNVTDSGGTLNGGQNSISQFISITVNPANDSPIAVNDSGAGFATTEDTGFTTGNVLLNDTLGDTPSSITAFDATSVSGGTVSYNNDGTFTYTPAANINGSDTFTYTLTDTDGETSTATVTITIAATNDSPTAVNDSGIGFATTEDTGFTTGNVLLNDTLGDTPSTITAFDATSTLGGTVSYNNDGTLNYTPAANVNGSDTFTYTLTDTDGETSTATVTITIAATNDSPIAVNDSGVGFATTEDTAFTTGNVLLNDTLGDTPSSITAFDATSARGGTVSYNNDGTFTYTPAANINGSDSFTYTLTDTDGETSTATVTITIAATNDSPIAVNDSGAGFATSEDTGFTTGNVLLNDNLGDTPSSITAFDNTSARGGTVAYNNDGTFTYTPAANISGSDSFTYTLTDTDGETSTATVTISITATNDSPVAVNDSGVGFATIEDTAFTTGNVLLNDNLGDTPSSITAFDNTSARGGSVSYNNDGTFNYTPAANVNGSDTFTYTLTDTDGETSTATVTITIAATNDSPIAVNDSGAGFATTEDTGFTTGNVLLNDTLGDTPSSITAFDNTSARGGTISYNNDGTFNYTPAANINGSDTFTYTLTDTDGESSTATVTITIAATNDSPTAVNDSGVGFATTEDTGFTTGNVLLNDTLGDTPSSITAFDNTSARGGTVAYNNDGTFTYTPAANVNGSDTFTYTLTDTDGETSTATVTITIAATNDSPIAVNDSGAGFATTEDTGFTTGNVLLNDNLGDTPSSITAFDNTSARGGTVAYNNDGTFTYTPAANISGSDSFTYTLTDTDGETSTATVTISITATNDSPVAVNDSGVGFATIEDTAFTTGNVLLNDNLGDTPSSITAFDNTSARGGSVSYNNDGTFNYTPAAYVNGSDTFTYTLTDTDGETSTATVTITIAATNDSPIAVNDSGAGFATTEDAAFTTGNVLLNDTLGDTPSSITAFDSSSVRGGTVAYNNDGTFTYTPAANVNGSDTFTYTLTDTDGETSTATVTITIAATNDSPVAINDSGVGFATTEDTAFTTGNVLLNDNLGDTPSSITAFDATSARGGTVSYNNDGTFNYTPAANINGSDTFTYTLTDTDGETSTATVTITIAATNDSPVAVNDSGVGFTTTEDTAFTTGDVLLNDNLGDTPSSITAFDNASARGGTVSYNNDGTFNYTPAANINGSDTFTYTLTDNDGETSTATVTIAITATNDSPIAVNDSGAGFATPEDTGFTTGNVLLNDTLGDTPSNITAFDNTSSRGGSVSYNNDGTFTYTPASNINGSDTFTYTLTDTDGETSTATVTISITATNDSPVAVNDSGAGFATTEDTAFTTGDVLLNDNLGDTPSSITAFDTTSVRGGTVAYNNDGTFRYTPASNINGSDNFTYTLTDTNGETSTATVTISITATNDSPVAVNDSGFGFATTEDTGFTTGNVLLNDNLGDTLSSITAFDATGVSGGTVNYNNDGTFTYIPAANVNGSDTFTYTLTDNDGETSTATVTITISATNDSPVAANDTYATTEGTLVTTSNVLANDNLGDTPTTITAVDATSANGGTVVNNGDGTFDYTPAANYNGSDTFTYTITDGDGQTSTATVTITIAAINDAPTGSPVPAGNAISGETLTANTSGIDDADGLGTISYNWQRSTDEGANWTTVGNDSSYVLVDDDVGAAIRVQVAYIDGQATAETLFSDSVVPSAGEPILPVPPELVELVDDPPIQPPPVELPPTDSTPPDDGNRRGDTPVDTIITESSPIRSSDDLRLGGSTRLGRAVEAKIIEGGITESISELIEAAPPAEASSTEVIAAPDKPVDGGTAITQLELEQLSVDPQTRMELAHVDAVINNPAMWRGIDLMKRQMDETGESDEQFVVEVVSTTGFGLMAGMVAYALRGGALLASLMSIMPLWASYDPLPILVSKKKKGKEEEDSATDRAAESPEVGALFD